MSKSTTFLTDILKHKHLEVAHLKDTVPVKKLEESIHFSAPTVSLIKYLLREDRHGVIAEIKRRSPSGGTFHNKLSVAELSIGYMQAGASALSILTDQQYFGGNGADLTVARQHNFCPILRKDFVIDEYQIFEARSWGADVILLIASCLTDAQLKQLTSRANSLGLESLIEIHSQEELDRVAALGIGDLLGVNQRDLKTLIMNKGLAEALSSHLPSGVVTVAESGISSPEEVSRLKACGYRGFLIGEHFMRQADPARACREFLRGL